MSARLNLTIVRSGPLFRLGLHRFCCHDACTSWYFALCCIELCMATNCFFSQPHSLRPERVRRCAEAHNLLHGSAAVSDCLEHCSRERQRANRSLLASMAPKLESC